MNKRFKRMDTGGKIALAHGSGGQLTHDLIKEVFVRNFKNRHLEPLGDSAVVKIGRLNFAFTTDSFVVDPIFFPGGDIGSLAVCGTINDLAVTGATPLFLSCGIIMEEGLAKKDLIKIVMSMRRSAKKSAVEIVTGDTKVVEKGSADKIFINTSGIGLFDGRAPYSTADIRAGDCVLVTGTIGDHGAAIISKRKGMDFNTGIKSDSASIYPVLKKLRRFSGNVRFMRDPTRGGVATTLNEIAQSIPCGIEIYESELPFKKETRSLSEILGLDPLYFPNEGAAVIICSAVKAGPILETLKRERLARGAKLIGHITKEGINRVFVRNSYGGRRLLEMLRAEQLPRIC